MHKDNPVIDIIGGFTLSYRERSGTEWIVHGRILKTDVESEKKRLLARRLINEVKVVPIAANWEEEIDETKEIQV